MPVKLSDREIYERLHQALLLFHNTEAESELGRTVMAVIYAHWPVLQTAMLAVMEADIKHDEPIPPVVERPSRVRRPRRGSGRTSVV